MVQEFETLGTSIEGSSIKYTKQIPRENENAEYLHSPTKEMWVAKERNRLDERKHGKPKFIKPYYFKCYQHITKQISQIGEDAYGKLEKGSLVFLKVLRVDTFYLSYLRTCKLHK